MHNQQRRPFFQTSTSDDEFGGGYNEIRNGHFRSCGWIAVISTALLFCSCASLTPDRVAVLAAIAGQAAQIGAEQWLAKNPSHREAFNLVITAIAGMVKAGVTDQSSYARLLQSLPTDTLAGPDGAVYITGDRLVIRDESLNKSVVVKEQATMPVVKATLSGLKRGVAPLPPTPRLPVKSKKLPPVAVSNWFSTLYHADESRPAEIRPGTNAVEHRNFPPAALVIDATVPTDPLSRTNVTRSITDVQHHAGSASVVSVRWWLGPNSIYYVQRDEGAAWLTFACVTNAVGSGSTNFCFPWPPGVQVGSWRVLRVR